MSSKCGKSGIKTKGIKDKNYYLQMLPANIFCPYRDGGHQREAASFSELVKRD